MNKPLRYQLSAQLLAGLLAMSAVVSAHASAPFSTLATPGYARVMVGDVEVTPLSDGTADLPMVDLLKNPKPDTQRALDKAHLTTPTTTSVNAYIVNTGSKLVLVDSGSGVLLGPSLGKLLASLKASGYQPEQVDDILITHLHPDHVGGLVDNGQMVFPSATIHVNKRDADFWLSESNMAKSPKDFESFFKGAMVSLKPYVQANKLKPIEQDGAVVPGISAYASFGHTAGHTTYVVESKGKKLVILGDLIHVASVQFDSPGVTIAFDSDPAQAAKARNAVFSRVAKEGDLVAGAHLQFPGLGYIRANGKGWTWIPANYTARP